MFSKLRFSKFKKFVFRSVFGELQLTQILSLNFKTLCSNLKIRGLGATVCSFSILTLKDALKSKSPYILLNKNMYYNENETELKMCPPQKLA